MSGNAILLAPYNEGDERELVGPVNRSENADSDLFEELTMTKVDGSQF